MSSWFKGSYSRPKPPATPRFSSVTATLICQHGCRGTADHLYTSQGSLKVGVYKWGVCHPHTLQGSQLMANLQRDRRRGCKRGLGTLFSASHAARASARPLMGNMAKGRPPRSAAARSGAPEAPSVCLAKHLRSQRICFFNYSRWISG